MSKTTMKPWTLEEFQEIVNLPTHLIAIISADATFYKVNEVSNAILGWEPHEAHGAKVADFCHPEDWDETLGTLSGLFLGTTPLVTEFINRCKSKDGDYRWISWSAKIRGGRIYAMGTDVTEKIQFEQELTIQGLVLESISEGVVITDEDGRIVYINSAEEKLFGYDEEELLGKPLRILNAHKKQERELIEVYSAIEKDGIWLGEWENIKKDGTIFTTSCRVTILMLNGERHYVVVQRDISQKKQQALEQVALQSRFKAFFEQSILPMEIYDLEGNALEVNQAWIDLFETSVDQLSHYNLLTDPTTAETGMLEYVKKAYAGEAVEMPAFFLDPKRIGKLGRGRWIEAWFSPVKDENNRVKELAVILKDVTVQKETQAKLEQSIIERRIAEDRLNMAVKIGQIGIWEWKPGSDKVYWDETLELIYGYAPGTFSGNVEDYTNAIHPDDKELMWGVIQKSQAEKKPYMVEHRIFKPDGKIGWVQCSGTTFYDEKSNPIMMMGTSIDITEKKLAVLDQKFLGEISEMLASSFNIHENLQGLANSAINYFCDGCIVDRLLPDGEIERMVVSFKHPDYNEHFFNLHKRYPQRLTQGHPLFDALITGKTIFVKDANETKEVLRKQYGEEYFAEISKVTDESSIFLRLKGRENLLGAITFVTMKGGQFKFDERSKWLAEEIAYRASMAVENSFLYLNSQEAIKTRDEFLSIASHELKTPLTSLTLQNQMKKRQLDKGDKSVLEEAKMRKFIESEDHQLKRINRLIDDMLDIARIRAQRLTVHKEPFEFCQFINDVIERFKPQMEAVGCEVTTTLCEPLSLEGDVYRIEQVVVNMLTNAMKYGAGRPIWIELQKNKDFLRFKVHDNGPGIESKDTERIFQRFERAVHGREISGLGLGLYISRQIVEQHDGSLYVTSNPGVGSTFVMDLPL